MDSLFATTLIDDVKSNLLDIIKRYRQPSASELLLELEHEFGWEVRWTVWTIIHDLIQSDILTRIQREYFLAMIEDDSLVQALTGDGANTKVQKSTFDSLLEECTKYRNSKAFTEMIEFMAKFRRYSPYNNMLVKIQNPNCSYYATQYDWYDQFGRTLKEDARPMLILAPMHPVMLVYDLDQTEGKELPQKINDFARFEGDWNPKWLANIVENANKYMIKVQFKKHSSTSAGFATLVRGNITDKMRISIHNGLDEPSRFGVLCHELAHIFLGHLGSDQDRWWPSRLNLTHASVEVEAEAVAYTVTQRLGLKGNSDAYLSSYLNSQYIPNGISIDYIAKISGKIEEMATGYVAKPKRK